MLPIDITCCCMDHTSQSSTDLSDCCKPLVAYSHGAMLSLPPSAVLLSIVIVLLAVFPGSTLAAYTLTVRIIISSNFITASSTVA